MSDEPIYVRRKGTASTSIDADSAYPTIYRARARWRAQRRELAQLVAFALALVAVGAAVFAGFSVLTR